MISQRPPDAAPVVCAVAEALPLHDESVDAALAVLTVHHWADVSAGIREMQRVARRRLVFFTWRPEVIAEFWLRRGLSACRRRCRCRGRDSVGDSGRRRSGHQMPLAV